MDRSARIVGVWIVGCMILGGSLIIANIPLGQPWSEQQIWLVRLGMIAIGLGVLGMVAEFLVAMRAWRGRKPEPVPVDVTPAELSGYFRTLTGVQAGALVAPYRGQPIRFSGVVQDVTPSSKLVSFGSPEVGDVHVMATFSRKWSEPLSRLRRGQHITVIGTIGEVDAYTFVIRDSRLVSSEDQSPSAAISSQVQT